MTLLALDIGLDTGVALLCDDEMTLDTVDAPLLSNYLRDLNTTLTAGTQEPLQVVGEKPLTRWRGSLSRELDGLITTVALIFPQAIFIDASRWKWQQKRLRKLAETRYPALWFRRLTPHERDACCIALWWMERLHSTP